MKPTPLLNKIFLLNCTINILSLLNCAPVTISNIETKWNQKYAPVLATRRRELRN